MEIDSVSATNPYSGLVNTQHVNASHINAPSPVHAPQPLSQPAPLHPGGIAANSEANISSSGQLINADDALQMAALTLVLPRAFIAQTVTSSNPSVATASAKNVPSGIYNVQVTQLAQAQILTSSMQVSPYSPIGSGATTLNFTFANGTTRSISLASNDNNLAAISSAINQAHLGISARTLTTSAGTQLQLTGQTGVVNSFSVNASGNNAALTQFFSTATGGGLTQTTAALDARGSVTHAGNSIAFSSSTNAVFTATPGLALNLNGVGSASLNVAPSSVNVSRVQSFINAFNHLQAILQRFAEGEHELESLPSLQRALSLILNQSQPALAGVGVTPGPRGSLSINSELFQAALINNPAAVAQVFSNNGSGFAERILALIESSPSLSPPNLLQLTASEGRHEIERESVRQSEGRHEVERENGRLQEQSTRIRGRETLDSPRIRP